MCLSPSRLVSSRLSAKQNSYNQLPDHLSDQQKDRSCTTLRARCQNLRVPPPIYTYVYPNYKYAQHLLAHRRGSQERNTRAHEPAGSPTMASLFLFLRMKRQPGNSRLETPAKCSARKWGETAHTQLASGAVAARPGTTAATGGGARAAIVSAPRRGAVLSRSSSPAGPEREHDTKRAMCGSQPGHVMAVCDERGALLLAPALRGFRPRDWMYDICCCERRLSWETVAQFTVAPCQCKPDRAAVLSPCEPTGRSIARVGGQGNGV